MANENLTKGIIELLEMLDDRKLGIAYMFVLGLAKKKE